MKIFKVLSPILLILSLTACSPIGEKNTDFSYIYGATSILSLLLLAAYCFFTKKKTPWFLLLFSSVLVVNLGYFSLSISKTLEEALLANRISYLGSVFLPYSILMLLIDLIKLKRPRWLSSVLLILCCIVFLIAASPGYLDIYYADASIEFINGITVLNKTYGPWHALYLYYLAFYFISMLAFTGYVIVKKKIQSIIYTFILTLSVAFNIVIWLLEQLVHIDFEILSVSYIITELFLLVLFYLMDEGYSPLSVSNPSPSIIPVENSPSFPLDQDTVSNSPSDTSSTEDTSAVVEATEFVDSNMALSNETAKIEFFITHLESLTPAEQKIYHLYLQKKSTREILSELCITENTLKYHNKNLYSKLGVNSRKELFAIASKLPCESPNSNQ